MTRSSIFPFSDPLHPPAVCHCFFFFLPFFFLDGYDLRGYRPSSLVPNLPSSCIDFTFPRFPSPPTRSVLSAFPSEPPPTCCLVREVYSSPFPGTLFDDPCPHLPRRCREFMNGEASAFFSLFGPPANITLPFR